MTRVSAVLLQAGMATPDHTPQGRGYQEALHYFHHDNVTTHTHSPRSSVAARPTLSAQRAR
jgi:hypothetical protein